MTRRPSTVRRALVGLAIGAAAVALLAGAGHRRGPPRPAGPAVVVVGGAAPPAASDPGPLEVSRTFVDAYVAFIYGRLAAARLPRVSPRVRRQAGRQHPSPDPAVLAAADPRLRGIRLTRRGPRAARAAAVIEDGTAVYEVWLVLRRLPDGWTITGLGENS